MLSYQKLPQWLKVSLAFPLIFLMGLKVLAVAIIVGQIIENALAVALA